MDVVSGGKFYYISRFGYDIFFKRSLRLQKKILRGQQFLICNRILALARLVVGCEWSKQLMTATSVSVSAPLPIHLANSLERMPGDCFLLVSSYLSPCEVFVNRRVAKQWRTAGNWFMHQCSLQSTPFGKESWSCKPHESGFSNQQIAYVKRIPDGIWPWMEQVIACPGMARLPPEIAQSVDALSKRILTPRAFEEPIHLLPYRSQIQLWKSNISATGEEVRVPQPTLNEHAALTVHFGSAFSQPGDFGGEIFALLARVNLDCLERNRHNYRNIDKIFQENPVLGEDAAVMLWAVKHSHGSLFPYASARFRNDRSFVLWFLQTMNAQFYLDKISPQLRDDPEIVEAMLRGGFSLKHAGERFRDDKILGLRSVKEGCFSHLRDLSLRLRDDPDVVAAACQNSPQALEYASLQWKSNKSFVLQNVQKWGPSLQYATEELRNDEEIVRAAIRNNPSALEYASPRWQDDETVVLNCVQRNSYVLQYASARLQNNENVVIAARKIARRIT